MRRLALSPFVLTLLIAGSSFAADPAPNTLTDQEKAAGWKILFDGKNNYGLRGLTYNDFINRGWKIGDQITGREWG